MKGYRYCLACGKRVNEEGKCPTPDACERLKRPRKKLIQSDAATRRRVRRAERESSTIGISRDDVKAPPTVGTAWR